MARDWNAIGVTWSAIDVSKGTSTPRVLLGQVQSPQAIATKEGIDAMIGHFGHANVAKMLNASGTFDVRARSWYKGRYRQDSRAIRNMDAEAMREAVYSAVLCNVSSRGGVRVERETTIIVGPFRVTFKAGEDVSYVDVFGAALAANIDANPNAPIDFLRTFVAQSLATAGIVQDDDEDDTETDNADFPPDGE
jgi:hypothetical protein